MLRAFLVVSMVFISSLAAAQEGLTGAVLLERAFEGRTKDDLTPQIRRRMVRVLVSTNQANFIALGGELGGFEYELTQQYRKYLKTRVKRSSWPVSFIYIPLPFDDLIPALLEGRGDIIAAGMTQTPERDALVDFTIPYINNISEVLVTAPGVEGIENEDDLSGRHIYAMKGSSYVESLNALNMRLKIKNLNPVKIVDITEDLATEDLLEMLEIGVIDLAVADSHVAGLWQKVYPNMKIRKDIVLRDAGGISWAVRKNNPEMLESLNVFLTSHRKGTLIGNVLFKRYFSSHEMIVNPLTGIDLKRLSELQALFEKYSKMYGIDWRLIAALAYQESKFVQDLESPVGAVGIMQVMPDTAAYHTVDISDIDRLENNIHAGVKYLAYLRDNYFQSDDIAPNDKINFALASYNAGPHRVSKLRTRASKHNRKPNVWFEHVEIEARRVIGFETVDYVGNINKYFIAYTLIMEQTKKRDAEKKKLEKTN